MRINRVSPSYITLNWTTFAQISFFYVRILNGKSIKTDENLFDSPLWIGARIFPPSSARRSCFVCLHELHVYWKCICVILMVLVMRFLRNTLWKLFRFPYCIPFFLPPFDCVFVFRQIRISSDTRDKPSMIHRMIHSQTEKDIKERTEFPYQNLLTIHLS